MENIRWLLVLSVLAAFEKASPKYAEGKGKQGLVAFDLSLVGDFLAKMQNDMMMQALAQHNKAANPDIMSDLQILSDALQMQKRLGRKLADWLPVHLPHPAFQIRSRMTKKKRNNDILIQRQWLAFRIAKYRREDVQPITAEEMAYLTTEVSANLFDAALDDEVRQICKTVVSCAL